MVSSTVLHTNRGDSVQATKNGTKKERKEKKKKKKTVETTTEQARVSARHLESLENVFMCILRLCKRQTHRGSESCLFTI